MSITTKKPKKYIRGSAKEVRFDENSSIINLDLNLADLQALPVSASGYVKITVASRRETDNYGNTHSVYENTFKPEKRGEGAEAPKAKEPLKPLPSAKRDEPSDDMPF